MMLHIEFILDIQMIVDASLTENRIDAVVLSEKEVAELFLSFVLAVLELLSEDLLTVLVNETIESD